MIWERQLALESQVVLNSIRFWYRGNQCFVFGLL